MKFSQVSHVESILAKKDARLRLTIENEFRQNANFDYLQNRFLKTYKVKLSTTEDELKTPSNFMVIHKCSGGDILEAYSCLYRLRWIKYRGNNTDYILTPDTDMRNDVYKPGNELQKKRFSHMNNFMTLLDKMPSEEREEMLSGKPFAYSKLPGGMKEAMKDALGVLIDAQSFPEGVKKPDINELTKAKIVLAPKKTVPGDNVKEFWFDIESNVGSFGFRWNDSTLKDNTDSKREDVEFSFEVESNEKFSRDRMIEKNNYIKSEFVSANRKINLISLLKDMSRVNKINVLSDPLPSNFRWVPVYKSYPLDKLLDDVCIQLKDWEWELSAGRFIVLRAGDSPRKRLPRK